MKINITIDQWISLDLDRPTAETLIHQIDQCLRICQDKEVAWQLLSQHVLPAYPFAVHLCLLTWLFPTWRDHPDTAPVWQASPDILRMANLTQCMSECHIDSITTFHRWTVEHYPDFWRLMMKKLHLVFKQYPKHICDLTQGIEAPRWFPGASMNIADSCFTAPTDTTAILYRHAQKNIRAVTYDELNRLSNRIANSLTTLGFTQGDVIGIIMPMTLSAVAIYLGLIKMGAVVVSIADSFSSDDIAKRLHIAKAKAAFTQETLRWSGKTFPLYEKVQHASLQKIIVLSCNDSDEKQTIPLRPGDYRWEDFLVENETFSSFARDPMSTCHILFSSGTTAEPKAISWNHTTAIKAASDAYLHQNIKANDVLLWPTNLGWMMGPWLIFAALINHATIALYSDAPKDRDFGEFVQATKTTLLGVVPTLVALWRHSHCMEGLDWQNIKVFSSTGECSNPEDMLYLMSLAHYKPIIEYCGGTEIGGAYVSSTVLQKNYLSLFSTPTMGLDFLILDEQGKPSSVGEVAIIPPSIGLSVTLLNADHHQVYFASGLRSPKGQLLRQHGDELQQLSNGYYCVLGRIDDVMNLGGIKISAAEIERALIGLPDILETAAISMTPRHRGPSQLVIYAATEAPLEKQSTLRKMQQRINQRLNPLFKIHDVVFVKELPKTASNKIMRRTLRKQ